MTAGDVMDTVAALLNDTAKSVYTYTAQLPYLKTAYQELSELLEANSVSITNSSSATLVITTSMTDIGGSTGPALPTDLIEIQELFERTTGSNEDFLPMTRQDYLPKTTVLLNELVYWTWQNQIIKFLGALSSRDVQINYIANSLGTLVDQATSIPLINAKSWLSFRTGMLVSKYIGENPTRAQELGSDLQMAEDRLLGINTKGRQVIAARRRPFMSQYKTRGIY